MLDRTSSRIRILPVLDTSLERLQNVCVDLVLMQVGRPLDALPRRDLRREQTDRLKDIEGCREARVRRCRRLLPDDSEGRTPRGIPKLLDPFWVEPRLDFTPQLVKVHQCTVPRRLD